MHIAICISSMGQGGAERIASIMANHWVAKENEVSIITLAVEGTASVYPLHENVGLYNLGMSRKSEGLFDKLLGNMSRVLGVRKQLQKIRPDVVVSFMDTMNIVVLFAALRLNLPIIATEHCHPEQFPVGKIWGALRKLMYPRASAVVVLGEEIRQWFAIHLNSRRLAIIHNPVIIPPVEDSWKYGGSNTVIAAGRLAEEKRFDMLIDAFSRTASDNPDWTLVIYGEGPDRGMLEELVCEKNLESRVQLPGWVDDLHERMLMADIFAMSSRSEAFPGALCEAMACGLAVVSFDCPSGPREIIRDDVDGVLVPTGDVDALAVELNTLMNDQSLRRRYGARAVEVTERFSLERIMGKWKSLIEASLRSDGSGVKEMHVALIVYSMAGLGGGMERAATNLSNGWDDLGHKVTILTLSSPDVTPHYPLRKKISVKQLDLRRPADSKWEVVKRMFSTAAGLRRAVKDIQADVVVAFGGQTCVLAVAGCFGSGIPVVVAERTHPAHYPIGRGWGGLRKATYPFAAAIVAQTADIAQWYQKNLYVKKVDIIPNPILYSACVAVHDPNRPKAIVGVGLLAEVKRFHLLIQAFGLLAERFPRWELIIYGEGGARSQLEQLVLDSGLDGRVLMPGRVKNIHEKLANADLFVMTSRTEGFPNALGEAMACGLPAVSFDFPSGPGDIVRHGVDGFLVESGDISALASAMEKLMSNTDLRHTFGEKAQEVTKRFSVERVMDMWERLFEGLS